MSVLEKVYEEVVTWFYKHHTYENVVNPGPKIDAAKDELKAALAQHLPDDTGKHDSGKDAS